MNGAFLFIIRWVINSFGIWLTFRWFGDGYDGANFLGGASIFLTAGLILAVINILIKPIITIISFPITILTLGLFTLITNGLMVYLALKLAPDITITFGVAILAGIIIGNLNFAITTTLKELDEK